MRSYEIEGPRLSVGATHKLKPSPSAWPESQNIYIPLRSTSYVLDSIPNPCVDQFLTTLRNSSWISRLIKPLTTKQSNTSMTQTQGGHSQPMAWSDMTDESTSWKPETCGLEYYNTSMTTSSWDILVKTKPSHQSDTNIHGLDFGTSSPSFVSPVPPVCILNHSATGPMACSNNYWYQINPGIQFQWTS